MQHINHLKWSLVHVGEKKDVYEVYKLWTIRAALLRLTLYLTRSLRWLRRNPVLMRRWRRQPWCSRCWGLKGRVQLPSHEKSHAFLLLLTNQRAGFRPAGSRMGVLTCGWRGPVMESNKCWDPIPGDIEFEAGYTLVRVPTHTYTLNQSLPIWGMAINA